MSKSLSDKQLSFKGNPYQYIRGIRFRANPTRQSEIFKEKSQLKEEPLDLKKLLKNLSNFSNKLENLLFYEPKDVPKNNSKETETNQSETSKKSFKKNLSIKKQWLSRWHKERYHSNIKDLTNRQGKYSLSKLNDFDQWLEGWKSKVESLGEIANSPEESQARYSDIADNIRFFINRNRYDYILDFLNHLHDSKSYNHENKVESLKDLLQTIYQYLKSAEKKYLCSQASGIEITKASFNYYTLNKKARELDDEREKSKKKLDCSDYSCIKKDKNNNYNWELIKDNNKNKGSNNNVVVIQGCNKQEKQWIEKYLNTIKDEKGIKGSLDSSQDISLSLDQTYKMMKAFKANQKSYFYEIIKHVANKKNSSYSFENGFLKGFEIVFNELNLEGINKNFSLFKFTELKSSNKGKERFETAKKILSKKKEFRYKNEFTKEEIFNFYIELTRCIQYKADNNKNKKLNNLHLHPKFRFLNQNKDRSNFHNKPPSLNIENPTKKRGEFLSGKFGKDCYFKNYENFCNTYKEVAKKRGCVIAQIKGIEKEKEESQNIDFWSLIYSPNEKQKQLWLVPKEKRKEASKFINEIKEANKNLDKGFFHLYYFESLTMRALHKLCFAEQSTFVRDMPENLKKLQERIKKIKTIDNNGEKNEQKVKEKQEKELELFKGLLKTEYAHEKLNLKHFEIHQWIDDIKNLEDFELKLEDKCYYPHKIKLEEKDKKVFIEKYDVSVLDISSYDLEERNKKNEPQSEDRLHTHWWHELWKHVEDQNYTSKIVKGFNLGKIRLNPEVRIRYRKADEEFKKYYYNSKKFSSDFKHRQLKDQYTAHFSLAINAGKKYPKIAFSNQDEIENKIQDFNNKLNQEPDFKNAWKYGIDRGNIELATLCIAKFDSKDTYTVKGKTVLQPTFPNGDKDIKCYKLIDYNCSKNYKTKKGIEQTRYAVDNPSYFIDDNNLKKYFEEKSVSCLDLTTAKVIKGKIITNGDVKTYLKLKKSVAKRRLFEMHQKGELAKDALVKISEYEANKEKCSCAKNCQCKNKNQECKCKVLCQCSVNFRPQGVFNIKTNNGLKTIYWYLEEYEKIISKENIQKNLNRYLQELKAKQYEHTPSILKINHLRDAITANMVGVICHLQKEYPGFIILEDLTTSMIDKHFLQHNENNSRRLENALYNKFQTLGLAPPHIKNMIELREAGKKLCQFGAIVFVPEKNTSKDCPYCEQLLEKQYKKETDNEKFMQQRFLCRNCNFDTYFFKPEKERAKDYKPTVNEGNHIEEFNLLKDINDNDKVAAYNVAKKKKE